MGSATPLTIAENQSMAAWNLMILKELEDENARLKKLFGACNLNCVFALSTPSLIETHQLSVF